MASEIAHVLLLLPLYSYNKRLVITVSNTDNQVWVLIMCVYIFDTQW
jgi:hypothetical protein